MHKLDRQEEDGETQSPMWAGVLRWELADREESNKLEDFGASLGQRKR